MASFTGVNGTPVSAAMLTDPKTLKKHLANGTPISSHSEPLSLSARRGSEPPHSKFSFGNSLVPHIAQQQAKDDAYYAPENQGKTAMKLQNANIAGQAASSTFDPRSLLDPRGFQLNGSSSETNDKTVETNSNPSETNGNGLRKRDHEDYEGQGMGSLIEKVHNVSQREERPQKKPKIENGEFDVEEDKKASFVGGGNGGEIGGYLKEKKKQGIAESGSVNPVVDLTGGTYLLLKQIFLKYRY